MPHYELGDLTNYITNDFYSIDWRTKLSNIAQIVIGLVNIHSVNILHRDFHSGNIFFHDGYFVYLGDFGLSKSATEITDDDNNKENYGIIPYMDPETFKGKKYTKESDIYSLGMIMWEFMTSRRPFWNRSHDAELIIEICNGLRPPIVTNAPKGYIELMKECWHSDPNKRPVATDIYDRINKMHKREWGTVTKIIQSSDIGPVTKNNSGAIYRSRPLSGMIQSAMFTMSTRKVSNYHQKNDISFNNKRKFDDTQIENSFNEGKFIKKVKLIENENNDYTTQEFELDIDINSEQCFDNERYITHELDFDI
ncbi:kinase-like domain-containing protein [Rhizophagus irregularis DAOM 181602=DAOM 197198]|uniref:Kinase-like domain-containing protein n=1 Tax=Rhizophagus irregularis (strain DAOM 181602 / DAOM 197198 / MUCL 43194) TaxID=747089 RepID=A0A2P4PQT1_RHIID|nr:kinase-like domain-containing protein [Rhizophagus irregularis DAOM 181602=DAOM 197198]POG67749.1 kinase-like domain-containing protein [Rhizophagus irregularis DAOM 181602=DAOM 197198]|eukprot:XP_025174615.1 kinase-like domain-containing protein [Rhizophagus irregularis DAOM 181602=DAOM 197198]